MKNKKFYIWEGVFDNFKKANRFKLGPGFSGKKWQIEQSKIFKICKDCSKNKKKIPRVYKERNLGLLFVIKKILNKKKNIKVLDYGGGFGIAYYILKENFEKKY